MRRIKEWFSSWGGLILFLVLFLSLLIADFIEEKGTPPEVKEQRYQTCIEQHEQQFHEDCIKGWPEENKGEVIPPSDSDCRDFWEENVKESWERFCRDL